KDRPPHTPAASADDAAIIHVWVIEDHEEFRNTVARVLALESDFRTDVFKRCEDALARLSQGSPVHVILLDIGLPGISGLEAIPQIKTLSPATQIIILTAFDDPPKVRQAIQSGAT